MDKLTLKHLTAYLPYGVKVVFFEKTYYGGVNENSYKDEKGGFAYSKQRRGTVTGYKNGFALSTIGKFDLSELNTTYTGAHVTHKFEKRLLLRSLSDLTKEITHNGETFVPIMRIHGGKDYHKYDYKIDVVEKPFTGKRVEISINDLGFPCISFSISNILNNRISYHEWQKLIEWHFDVFGLRDKNLCIYYNEL